MIAGNEYLLTAPRGGASFSHTLGARKTQKSKSKSKSININFQMENQNKTKGEKLI